MENKFNQTTLKWETFDGSLPNGAVSVNNTYTGSIDYVAKYGLQAGFYNPDKGPYCYYAYGEKELHGSPFQILVNKDNFEFLEWKDDSQGSVPENSVRTGCGKERYVGKNKYGLGKVDVKNTAFFLPWKGSEHWYKTYQVLTFNKEIQREHITEVKYKTDDVKIIECPPETMDKSVITNYDSQTVTGTAVLEKTTEVEQRWDTSFSLTLGVNVSITAQVPIICSAGIDFSAEATNEFTKGTSYTESTTHSVTVQYNVPPKHSCSVSMVGYKYRADIPFTARLSRTYSNGKTTWTSISGTFRGVQIGEVRAVVERSEPLPDPGPETLSTSTCTR